MSGSWRIGRIAGIDVYVHFTFLLLLGWVAISHYLAHGDLAEAMSGLAFILALFGIVVLHELGHALAARRYGIRTRDITLLPIGGVARLERMPEDPKQELVVALAGPAVNVVLAAGIYVMLALGQGLSSPGEVARVGGGFLDQLFWVNVSLVVVQPHAGVSRWTAAGCSAPCWRCGWITSGRPRWPPRSAREWPSCSHSWASSPTRC